MGMLMDEAYSVIKVDGRAEDSIILTVRDKYGRAAVCHLEDNLVNASIDVGDVISRWHDILLWVPGADGHVLFDKVIITKE